MIDGINYLRNQDPIRERLIILCKLLGRPLLEISKEIPLQHHTFLAFMNGRKTTWVCLCNIEKFCVRYEKILEQKEIIEVKRAKKGT